MRWIRTFYWKRICDAAKIIADVQHKITDSRRANILPLLEDSVRLALADSVPGKLLFGSNLPERIKDSKQTEKLVRELKKLQVPPKNSKPQGGRNPPQPYGEKRSRQHVQFIEKPGPRKPQSRQRSRSRSRHHQHSGRSGNSRSKNN